MRVVRGDLSRSYNAAPPRRWKLLGSQLSPVISTPSPIYRRPPPRDITSSLPPFFFLFLSYILYLTVVTWLNEPQHVFTLLERSSSMDHHLVYIFTDHSGFLLNHRFIYGRGFAGGKCRESIFRGGEVLRELRFEDEAEINL